MSDVIIAALLTGGVVVAIAVLSWTVAIFIKVGRILEKMDVFGTRITRLETRVFPAGGSEED
jgi:hypothetical protein